ncbi:MAG: tetratricopeptide repeat protein [Chthoniobacterales bacterium]
MDLKKFFAELQRRNVYKTAVAYGVCGWLLVEVATQVFPVFEVPNWVVRWVVILLLLGFPIAVLLAWMFELTAEGLKRTDEVPPAQSATGQTGRKLDFIIIAVLLAFIAVLAFQRYGRPAAVAAPALPETSIAVLPFADLSASRDQAYISDGLMEQIINALGRMHDLSVVARTSALAFRDKGVDIREVGRVLGVNHVLEGSVRRGRGKVRIDARLINVTTGYQLWSESYDSSEQDFLVLERDVAQKVARALEAELHLRLNESERESPAYDPVAYDLYLRGNYLLNKRTVESMHQAQALFQTAVNKDPQFALGYIGMADADILLGKIGDISGDQAATRAWPDVTKALQLDPQLAEGYVLRAILLTDFEWNWAAAEVDFQKALSLNPNSAAAHHWFARHLAQLGRFEHAVKQIEAAQTLDPLSAMIRVTKAKIFFQAQQYERGIRPCREALELEPEYAPAFSILGLIYAHLGQENLAVESMKKYVDLSEHSGWAELELAYVLAVAGKRAEAEKIVQDVTTRTKDYSPYDMAAICSVWHDFDGAIRWLEVAINRRTVDVVSIRVEPRLNDVRSDPRFRGLVERMVPRRGTE